MAAGFFLTEYETSKQPMKMNNVEMGSMAGAATSIGAAMTLTDWGILVGIVTALLTFALNVAYTKRKSAREQTLAEQQQKLTERQQRLVDLQEQEVRARLHALGLKP